MYYKRRALPSLPASFMYPYIRVGTYVQYTIHILRTRILRSTYEYVRMYVASLGVAPMLQDVRTRITSTYTMYDDRTLTKCTILMRFSRK